VWHQKKPRLHHWRLQRPAVSTYSFSYWSDVHWTAWLQVSERPLLQEQGHKSFTNHSTLVLEKAAQSVATELCGFVQWIKVIPLISLLLSICIFPVFLRLFVSLALTTDFLP
jgi:hypothetical protein